MLRGGLRQLTSRGVVQKLVVVDLGDLQGCGLFREQVILYDAFQCSTLLKYGDRNWARL